MEEFVREFFRAVHNHCSIEVIKQILNKIDDVNCWVEYFDSKKNPLIYLLATIDPHPKVDKILKLLIKKKVNINTLDNSSSGHTPLMILASYPKNSVYGKCAKILLKNGADTNVTNLYGQTIQTFTIFNPEVQRVMDIYFERPVDKTQDINNVIDLIEQEARVDRVIMEVEYGNFSKGDKFKNVCVR